MGIKTVAVYSEADSQALFVQMADEAHLIGPPPSAQSYLSVERIVEVVKRTSADAVHPGYGFLSENARFCAALDAVRCTFIGPSAQSMARMGDKVESKAIARAANVNTIPGHAGVVADSAEAKRIAAQIGYPVMLKASAGGGGKGMRIAWSEDQVESAFRLAAAEARSSFADDRLLVEKFVEEPRHVEFQILGDQHGNLVYLPERECSVQRRNQKVLEEAPSPFLDPALRRSMGEQAVRLARAVGYYSAGTVEFLVDRNREFYFLEMNTRLQVEHPITEMVASVDLVEQMIRIARGEPLSLTQPDLRIDGWAVEARVYAEDPATFLPSTGKLTRYIEPQGKSVRCDSGVQEGSEISVYYDPMICKLSCHGADRADTLRQITRALDSYVIRGVAHNIPLLREVLASPAFASGHYTTKLLAEQHPAGFAGHRLSADEARVVRLIGAHLHDCDYRRAMCRPPPQTPPTYCVSIDGSDYEQVDLPSTTVSDHTGHHPVVSVESEGRVYTVQRVPERPHQLVFMGTEYAVSVLTERQCSLKGLLPKAAAAAPDLSTNNPDAILSPMPGLVVSVSVHKGDTVAAGQEVAVIEAMKMQNVLKAAAAARVKEVHVRKGQAVGNRQVLIELDPQ